MLHIWTGKMAQSANCLSYKYEGLHWIPGFSKAKCAGMACNASTRLSQENAQGSVVIYSNLCDKLHISETLCLKKQG